MSTAELATRCVLCLAPRYGDLLCYSIQYLLQSWPVPILTGDLHTSDVDDDCRRRAAF